MKIILNHDRYKAIWDKIDNDYQFYPSYGSYPEQWLSLPVKSRKFRLNEVFTEEQEKIINSIFCRVNPRDMYALDWNHDCFIYDPREQIPPDYWFYDAERKCNVFFPSYYPNGDYHFFVSFDWTIGLYGHPWKEEIIVVGDQLIREFENARKMLNITEL